MRLQISKSTNAKSYYVVESIRSNGVSTSRVVEKLGNEQKLIERFGADDPETKAREYVKELTRKYEEGKHTVIKKYRSHKPIEKDKQVKFNGGYLFLQKIYHELGLNRICKDISKRHKFKYDLDSILSRLLYSRILYPSSKLATNELSKNFIEQPNFELQHIYRALDVLSDEMDFIQAQVYKNSKKAYDRNNNILYYDCTNYFFEIEEAMGLKQYGKCKRNQPSPIVQMGLFMDGDGTPLAFNITPGNQNEQVTLRPLEEQILKDFDISKLVVCTDAGLASKANRKFNDRSNRSFITTQSIKNLKKHLKEWALNPKGWSLEGSRDTFDISGLIDPDIPDDPREEEELKRQFEQYMNKTFYKERWIDEDGLRQKLIVSFSLKYKFYQVKIRNAQIERAEKLITTPSKLKKKGQNDVKRFITSTTTTADGEVAEKKSYSLNEDTIKEEMRFDGFYGVCSNLEDDATEIIKTNHKRWQIEECFRI
ncbi:MAG: transposase, partial [Lactobacillus sp.]|nr:transposase [Lactobacillus sp.]